MKNRPIHENLDTSFVNLSALIKYLRRRQFIGEVRIELSGYDADIGLTAENKMDVREHDRITGRVGEGEDALQRILIRAREPGGIINVYQKVETAENGVSELPQPEIPQPKIEVKPVSPPVMPPGQQTAPPARQLEKIPLVKSELEDFATAQPKVDDNLRKSGLRLPKFPFELSNKVETKARQSEISPQDWQTLLNLTAELLSSIDRVLAEANLDFPTAFEKARLEISDDYPFLHPVSGDFEYKNGKITMDEQINANLFVVSISESLRRIFDKLGGNQKFSEIYRIAIQKILALIHQRKPLYDKFSMTRHLEKITGN